MKSICVLCLIRSVYYYMYYIYNEEYMCTRFNKECISLYLLYIMKSGCVLYIMGSVCVLCIKKSVCELCIMRSVCVLCVLWSVCVLCT